MKTNDLFSEIQTRTEVALEKIEKSNHSLAVLLKSILGEQLEMLKELLQELSRDRVELRNMTEFLTIIYQDNEIANPTFRAWKRAVEWMDLPNQDTVKNLEPLFQEIKTKLEDAAKELERIYGAENMKYIIPSFYVNTVH